MSSFFLRRAKLAAAAAIFISSASVVWGASVIGGTYHDSADGFCENVANCNTKDTFGLAPSPSGVVIEAISCRILSYGGPPPANVQLTQNAAGTGIIYLPVAIVGATSTFNEFHANLTGLRWGVPQGSRPKVAIGYGSTQSKIYITCSINGMKN